MINESSLVVPVVLELESSLVINLVVRLDDLLVLAHCCRQFEKQC